MHTIQRAIVEIRAALFFSSHYFYLFNFFYFCSLHRVRSTIRNVSNDMRLIINVGNPQKIHAGKMEKFYLSAISQKQIKTPRTWVIDSHSDTENHHF